MRIFLNAFVILVVSFSPLIPVEVKMITFLLMTLINIPKLKVGFPFSSLHFFFIIILFGSFVRELWISASGTNFSFVGAYFLASLIYGFVVFYSIKHDKLVEMVENILFYGCMLSLLGVFIYTFFPSLIYDFPNYTNREFVHKTLGFTNFLMINAGPVTRNTGFASEPGMWQFLMNLGVLLHFYRKQRQYSLSRVAFYVLAIFTTVSTTGIFSLLATLIVAFRFFKVRHRTVISFALLILSPIFAAAIAYHFTFKIGIDSAGFMGRLSPAINIFENYSSVFGYGNVFYDTFVGDLEIGSYDSFSQIFIRYGLIGLSLYILMLISGLVSKKYFLLLPILFTSLSQVIWFYPITMFILLLAWLRINEKIKK